MGLHEEILKVGLVLIQDLSWLEIRAQVLGFDSCSFVSYLYQKCQPYHSFVPSRSRSVLQFING